MRSRIKTALAAAVLALVGTGVQDASALEISLNSCFTGDCGSFSGSVDLTLVDSGSDLLVTIENNSNGDVDYVRMLFDATLAKTTTELTGGATPTTTTYTPSDVLSGGSMFVSTLSSPKTDAGLSYNVDIDLPPPPGSEAYRLSPTESITFMIAGLSVEDLDLSLAHVISLDEDGSAKVIGVPDGGTTLSLLGGALLGLGMLRRKFNV